MALSLWRSSGHAPRAANGSSARTAGSAGAGSPLAEIVIIRHLAVHAFRANEGAVGSGGDARRRSKAGPSQSCWIRAEAVAQTMCALDFLCIRDKVAIIDRIISVAVEPLWVAGRLSRGRPKWRLSNPYNGLGLCDSLRQERQRRRQQTRARRLLLPDVRREVARVE